jgi:hypothetical protein
VVSSIGHIAGTARNESVLQGVGDGAPHVALTCWLVVVALLVGDQRFVVVATGAS